MGYSKAKEVARAATQAGVMIMHALELLLCATQLKYIKVWLERNERACNMSAPQRSVVHELPTTSTVLQLERTSAPVSC